jgi:putative FmdB family regulatory protein
MPIYEYRCSSCGHELEALQKFSDAPILNCPSCKADALVKLMSAAGFQLKGSGWYATDFKGSGAKPAPAKASGESKSESKSDTTDAAKSDGKSEAKGEAKSAPAAETKTESKGSGSASTPGTGAPPAST